MRQEAYAVVDTASGEVVINTIHETERGAKVNGLLVLFGKYPTFLWSDKMVDDAWNEEVCRDRHSIGKVAVVWVEEE